MITLEKVSCGHDSLPEAAKDALRATETPIPAIEGQLCFAHVSFHNDSNSGNIAAPIEADLYAGERRFAHRLALPLPLPHIFPGSERKLEFIFDIPREATPTKARFSYAGRRNVYYRIFGFERAPSRPSRRRSPKS